VTTKIDEEIFKPLFPGKMQGGYRWELIPHDEDGLTILVMWYQFPSVSTRENTDRN
jgi:hypothetical protein